MNRVKKIGERLKQERKRLNLSQVEAGRAVGVSHAMWGRYERGAVMGVDVESKLQGAGFDVSYIFTGIPASQYEASIANAGIPSDFDSFLDNPNLSEDEKNLLRYFRMCRRPEQNIALRVTQSLAKVWDELGGTVIQIPETNIVNLTKENEMASNKGTRILKIFKALHGHTIHGLSNKEIAEIVGTNAVNVVRDIEDLISEGFVERMDNGRFRLGIQVLKISKAHENEVKKVRARIDEMEQRIQKGSHVD